jgi:8-oxo-dGTP pyrophosphatase MutT (NUDIX family)
MGLDSDGDGVRLCRALHVCAAREVFEESGVLLARRGDGTGYGVDDAPALAASRRRLLDGAAFAAELDALDARLELDWLVYGAHFITPLGLPRRYDTRFFLARAPLEQDAAVHAAEAVDGGWWTPAEMLELQARGEAVLMPPTRILITELGRHATAAGAIAELGTRPVARILFDIRWLTTGAVDFDHLPTVEEMTALEASMP